MSMLLIAKSQLGIEQDYVENGPKWFEIPTSAIKLIMLGIECITKKLDSYSSMKQCNCVCEDHSGKSGSMCL